MNAVVRSARLKAKRSVRSPYLLASHVVVDPELTLDCPLRISGIAGLDALVQLVESYVSRKRKPVPRALVRSAFPAMLAALQRIPAVPADLEARTDAAYGSMISGLALANSGLGAAHGFAAGLGGLFPIPHGLICAVTLGPVLAANAPLIRDDLGDLLGGRGERPGRLAAGRGGGAARGLRAAARPEGIPDRPGAAAADRPLLVGLQHGRQPARAGRGGAGRPARPAAVGEARGWRGAR